MAKIDIELSFKYQKLLHEEAGRLSLFTKEIEQALQKNSLTEKEVICLYDLLNSVTKRVSDLHALFDISNKQTRQLIRESSLHLVEKDTQR